MQLLDAHFSPVEIKHNIMGEYGSVEWDSEVTRINRC